MLLFRKNISIEDAWKIADEAEEKLSAVIESTVGDNSKDYNEWNCEGEPYVYHGHKVYATIRRNEIDAYLCEVEDKVAHTNYQIYCGQISYEELETLVVKYIKAMCQY